MNIKPDQTIRSARELFPKVAPKIQKVEDATNEAYGQFSRVAKEELLQAVKPNKTTKPVTKSANLPHQGNKLDILAE